MAYVHPPTAAPVAGGMMAGAEASRQAGNRLMEAAGGHKLGEGMYAFDPLGSDPGFETPPRQQESIPDFFGFARLLRRPEAV